MAAPLAPLVELWRSHPLPTPPGRLVVPARLRAFFLTAVADRAPGPVLAIVPGERDAEELSEDAGLFCSRVWILPAWETLPFEHVSPNVVTMARRARARHRLASSSSGIVVASVRAAIQRVSPSPPDPLVLKAGAERDRDELIDRLAHFGYHHTDRVESRGEFAVRGGIVDVFPAQGDAPGRIDFWGDTIEELRSFEIAGQRSVGRLEKLVAYPAREIRSNPTIRERSRLLAGQEPWAAETWERLSEGLTFPGMESWLPWLAEERTLLAEVRAETPVVLFDPVRAGDRSRELIKEEGELAAALASTWGHGAPKAGEHPDLYISFDQALEGVAVLEAPATAAGPHDEDVDVRGFDAVAGDPASVAAALHRLRDQGTHVVVAMDGDAAADRVAGLLGEEGLYLTRRDRLEAPGSAVLGVGIHHGFVAPSLGVAVLGEQEIAGRRRSHRRAPAAGSREEADGYRDLEADDFVVHHVHGIGRFEGLDAQTVAGIERDYLRIAYAGGDKLYVPTDQLAAVRRYTGGESPRLSKMGGADWSAQRSRVRVAIAPVAERVVSLHRARALATGYAFGPDTPWQRELAASFPYEETPDQLRAVEDVVTDMESLLPMDRLVFGDVGFGKTEVAVRAVFKAVQESKQAAVLVPTTLLAQQHHQTFGDRLASYPIRIEMLSRFLTPKQQDEVVAGLGTGEVDVVVGTHRILSQDVVFKDLGLLVVDEEHRFGVSAKDRIKELRTSVDVLTLTATPIPRTLEMALTGVREVSNIRTPPEDRHPILTYVGPYDEQTVSAAVRRELLREGQVFYVHNRIQSMDHALTRLRGLVPDARYAVAHGRMSEGQLEQVMFDFWNHDYDVLVATTIIESGLDLPQVNTLIVERADRLGLAQLYQLRGRVGRSSQRAYAYLFHPPQQQITEDAHRRLEAIGEFSDLGSGFELARRDLEIRGAGSMLGEVQTGHIAAVGFDLYAELVAEAVSELETGSHAPPQRREVRIDLPVDAHLPVAYIAEQAARLEAYRRLAAAETQAGVDEVSAEWRDRYGPLPPQAEALVLVARLRDEALRVGLTEVVKLRDEVRLAPVDLSESQEVRLERLAPRSLLKRREGAIFLPVPDGELVSWLLDFVRTMWPPPEE